MAIRSDREENPIGYLSGRILDLEDRGKGNSAECETMRVECARLKSLPENWTHVRARNYTPEQAALAAADDASRA